MNTVYLIWAKGTSFYKIGRSSNPLQRLEQMQIGCPYTLELIGNVEAVAQEKLENRLHQKWADFSTGGEWFDIPPQKIPDLLLDFGLFQNPGMPEVLSIQAVDLKEVDQIASIFNRVSGTGQRLLIEVDEDIKYCRTL